MRSLTLSLLFAISCAAAPPLAHGEIHPSKRLCPKSAEGEIGCQNVLDPLQPLMPLRPHHEALGAADEILEDADDIQISPALP
jgi:hypothetical protein